jgi:archaellum biogenesis protein FlaJ (TadC family)
MSNRVGLRHGEVSRVVEWIKSHEPTIWCIAGASIVAFIASVIAVPLLVVRIPSDYFAHRRRHREQRPDPRSVVRGVLLIGKNLVGYVFIAAGIMMLVLPGPGMVTILTGVMLLNFPGKYRLERWIVSRRPVLRSVNRLRRRAGRPPLFLER